MSRVGMLLVARCGIKTVSWVGSCLLCASRDICMAHLKLQKNLQSKDCSILFSLGMLRKGQFFNTQIVYSCFKGCGAEELLPPQRQIPHRVSSATLSCTHLGY